MEPLQDSRNTATDVPPVVDSSSVTVTSKDTRKVSHKDVTLVHNLIEHCLQLYMTKDEVVKTLLNRARTEPGFTTLVNNLPMGYPVLQQSQIPAMGHIHHDSMGSGPSSCHVVNGVPAPGSFHHMAMNSGNGVGIGRSAADVTPIIYTSSAMSEMAPSPASVASSRQFPFTPSDISGIGIDTSVLDTTFMSDVASPVGLHLELGNEHGNDGDSLESFCDIPWNLSLSELTDGLLIMGDLGSPFLPSDSDILLNSPDGEDIVGDFFVDPDPDLDPGPSSQSCEAKEDKKEV
ncbi:hypothetical protein GIB67_006395 [Kingdonia uniflora]|uniref:Uncharacterized protein n=1 Tax=Kingdonia uniflora TaxID=39325 RepID=A0A7J7P0P8_9MAGN|nr:hypothetical protein GIB67_006395 [Kingdonia uniflora]